MSSHSDTSLSARFVSLPWLLQNTQMLQPIRISAVFTQSQFDEFARLSGDDNPIHVDPVFAERSRFGRTAAHGMFLFAVLQAAVAGSRNAPVRLRQQDLMFRAPTFTGDPLVISLDQLGTDTISEEITDSTNTITVSGTAYLGEPRGGPPQQPNLVPSGRYKGLEVGMSVSRQRVFTADDVADYTKLVNDRNPLHVGTDPEVPQPLLGGMVSRLLGVELPGRGANWLKQRYEFHRVVHVPAEVTTTVTITRIRPEKGLINLATTCTTPHGVALSGEALVLATDVADR